MYNLQARGQAFDTRFTWHLRKRMPHNQGDRGTNQREGPVHLGGTLGLFPCPPSSMCRHTLQSHRSHNIHGGVGSRWCPWLVGRWKNSNNLPCTQLHSSHLQRNLGQREHHLSIGSRIFFRPIFSSMIHLTYADGWWWRSCNRRPGCPTYKEESTRLHESTRWQLSKKSAQLTHRGNRQLGTRICTCSTILTWLLGPSCPANYTSRRMPHRGLRCKWPQLWMHT